MKNYTDITVLLDRSGSMDAIRTSMEGSFDEFINKHKDIPSTRITLIQFDDTNNQDVVYQNIPVRSVERLKLRPRGNTPLLDALCTAIDNTGKRFAAMDEVDRPKRVLFIVITDGQENASTWAKRTDVSNRVRTQRETYKWEFVYLGANQDAFGEAASFNIPHTHTIMYAHSPTGSTSAIRSLSNHAHAYTSTGDWSSFTKSEQAEAMDIDVVANIGTTNVKP